MTSAKELIGELRVLRAQRGMSQSALAMRLGVTKRAVASWEYGERSPSLGHLCAWAAAVGRRVSLASPQNLVADDETVST